MDSLKKHLVREHGVAERTSLSDAMAMLSGGKITAQQFYLEPAVSKPPLPKQKPPQSHLSNKSNMQRVAKSGQSRKRISGLDQNKDLDGYVEQVIKLPSGENHTVYVKRTLNLSSNQKNSPSPARGRNSSSSGKQSGTSTLKPASTTHRAGQQISPAQHQPLAPPKRSFKLSGPNDFKIPDPWVAQGANTTLWTSGKSFIARMGIDFGTAFTKASIGYGDDIYIVDWMGIKGGQDMFTLPGEFSVLQDESCVIGRAPDAGRVATDLKLPFLEGHASRSSLIDTTIFLALTMRYIRGWWFHHHKGLIKAQAIDWNINLGAPTTPWQDGNIRSKYEKVAKAAWIVSCSSEPITIAQVERVFDNAVQSAPPVEIVPEFVAQIASYTRSPQRQPDLHLLVDVGAGTVDVVTFNVHRDDETGEDRFPIFWASVSNLGTHYLMSQRLHGFPQIHDEQWSDATAIPSASEFGKTYGISVQDVEKVDKQHTKDVVDAISSVLRTTKGKRYLRSPNWKAGIRVFFCGGGSSCEVFEKSVPEASAQMGVPLHRIRLPLPNHLIAPSLSKEQFHRVSVAFGLGMDAFNLGQIIPTAEVADDKPTQLPLRAHITDFEDK
ncbi:MAG: hypothetical protein K8H75_09930 [Sulfuricella sp.]|nr:hypothetical protein [Sulfuricella sp.]